MFKTRIITALVGFATIATLASGCALVAAPTKPTSTSSPSPTIVLPRVAETYSPEEVSEVGITTLVPFKELKEHADIKNLFRLSAAEGNSPTQLQTGDAIAFELLNDKDRPERTKKRGEKNPAADYSSPANPTPQDAAHYFDQYLGWLDEATATGDIKNAAGGSSQNCVPCASDLQNVHFANEDPELISPQSRLLSVYSPTGPIKLVQSDKMIFHFQYSAVEEKYAVASAGDQFLFKHEYPDPIFMDVVIMSKKGEWRVIWLDYAAVESK